MGVLLKESIPPPPRAPAFDFRQTIYLPVPGLVPTDELTPGDLVGTNKDSYLILEKLPAEYDNRVKAMEVDEKPTEEYSDIGGESGGNCADVDVIARCAVAARGMHAAGGLAPCISALLALS